MWVVKLGGSLSVDPLLPSWLELLAQLGGGRVTVVGGGAGFADHVRQVQAHWRFDDLAAHNMAVLAMAQTAYQMNAINPSLQLAISKSDIRRVLQKGGAAVWLPLELQRDGPDASTNWDVTSDSIALDLARRLNAERLVVVKSCAIDRRHSLSQLTSAGIVDRRFAALAADVAFPIEVIHKAELDRVRGWLLGSCGGELMAPFGPRGIPVSRSRRRQPRSGADAAPRSVRTEVSKSAHLVSHAVVRAWLGG